MRRFLSFWACGLCLVGLAKAQEQPGDLFTSAIDALNRGDYTAATQSLDRLLIDYPTFPSSHEATLQDGIAYLHLKNYDKAIQLFLLESTPTSPDRGNALYYLGLAQLSQGAQATSGSAKKTSFAQAVRTMGELIQFAKSGAGPDSQTLLEEGYYDRALAEYYAGQYPAAENDARQLLAPEFAGSSSRPDYLLLLGNLFAQGASAASQKDQVERERSQADGAIKAYDQVIADPNALVQATEAQLAEAEVLYLVAGLDLPSLDGYQKALDAFRAVKRKADLLTLQQAVLDRLRAANQARLQSNPGVALTSADTRLIERETEHLNELQNGPDPVIQALIRIGECYNAMKQGNEARTVLHRLARATLTPDQDQEVNFAIIYSYVLANQTDKADQALTAYLARHPNDPQTQSINVQLAGSLLQRQDYQGALDQANRSLQLFPQGKYAAAAMEMKVRALNGLGQFDAAKAVVDGYVRQNPNSAVAIGMLLSRAQAETQQGNLNAALADYEAVRNNTGAGDLQASGDAGYIQTLQSLGHSAEVLAESKAFAAKYPTSPALPSVLVLGAVALDQLHQPGAVAALQDVARRFPQDTPDSPSPFALYYVVTIDQRTGDLPALAQAAADLAKAFPTRYPLLLQAADAVSAAYAKQKKFDLAIAQYQPLLAASDASVAALAQVKVGDLWVQSAKSMGAYQSMQETAQRAEAEKRLAAAEQAYLGVLSGKADQLAAVDTAFAGLDGVLLLRRSWGLLKDADFPAYLAKLTAGLTDPEMAARVALAEAGLVFIEKHGDKDHAQALASFRAAVAAHPGLALTRTEADRYGELLIEAKDYPTAQAVYSALLQNAAADPNAQAVGDYGLGAIALAQADYPTAKQDFTAMKALPGGAAWSPHILDADYGLALAAEQSGQPADLASAKQTYAMVMQAPQASVELQAKAILGYGRVLQKEGATTAPKVAGTIEYAVHYFQQVNLIYGPAVPDLSAEGLYDAAKLYESAGDKANAQKQYQAIVQGYATTAPDWVAKAQAAMAANP